MSTILENPDDNSMVIYESYNDISSEYKMSKIKINELRFLTFMSKISQERVKIVGFYGDFQECFYEAKSMLGLDINLESKQF